MKLRTLLEAVQPLQKLSAVELPLTTAYALSKRFSQLQGDIGFFEQERDKGRNINELLELEIANYEPIEISVKSNISLSVNDITCLTPFVNWIGGDDGATNNN